MFAAGIIAVPAGLIGLILGGYIVKRFDLKMRGILRLVVGVNGIVIFLLFMFLLRCENVDFAGVSVTYDGAAMTRFSTHEMFKHIAANRNAMDMLSYIKV